MIQIKSGQLQKVQSVLDESSLDGSSGSSLLEEEDERRHFQKETFCERQDDIE